MRTRRRSAPAFGPRGRPAAGPSSRPGHRQITGGYVDLLATGDSVLVDEAFEAFHSQVGSELNASES